MKSAAYWAKRFNILEQSQHDRGAAAFSEIDQKYRTAERSIEGKIASWYQRFANNNGITLQEAKQWLTSKELAEFKWDVNQYIQYGQDNAVNGMWVKELENASARYHISRLEALKVQCQQDIEVLFGSQLDILDQSMRDIYTSGFYHTAFEIQKGVGVGWDFSTLDSKTISKVINSPWASDGSNFSDRVWKDKQKLMAELDTTLTQNIILGQDPQKAIDKISKRLGVSKSAAGKLVMTEEAYFSSEAQQDCFKELDVEQYEIVATLDSITSEICRSMDGKVFKMSEWEVGITAPPFHPWCRTTTVPHFDDEFDVGERAARGKDGKTYYVPANMKYADWEKAFVDGDKSGVQPVQSAKTPATKSSTQPKTFKEKIQKVKDDIASSGGTVKESHLMEAGKVFSQEFADSRAQYKTAMDEAQAQLNAYGLDAKSSRVRELASARRGLKTPEEVGLTSMDEINTEYSRLNKEILDTKMSEEYMAAEMRRVEASAKYVGTQEDNIAWLKSKLGEVRTVGTDGIEDAVKAHLNNSRSTVRASVEKGYTCYPRDWVDMSMNRGTLTPKKVDRGFYSDWNGEIAISGWTEEGQVETAIHELGHRMEKAVPGILDAEKEFYARRTKDESLEWLGSGYAKSEKTRKDDFVHPYMGKDYGGSAYELVSMGFEYAFTDPTRLAKDPDMAAWIYGLLSLL